MKILMSVTFLLALLLMGGHAKAQETQIAVTPAIVDAPVGVGQSITKKIRITNGSESALPISIEVQAALIDGEPLENSSRDRFDVSDWVRFEQETYLFESGETKEIPFTITAPFTALPGGHYAHISLRGLTLQQEQDGEASSLIFPEVGVPLLVTVPGEIIEDARVSNRSLLPLFATPRTTVDLRIPIENTGTVHNLVSGKVVFEQDGRIVSETAIVPTVILPGTRKIALATVEIPGYGVYGSYVELSFGNRQTVSRSNVEKIYSTIPVVHIVGLAAITWTATYMWPRRRNVKAALKAVFTS